MPPPALALLELQTLRALQKLPALPALTLELREDLVLSQLQQAPLLGPTPRRLATPMATAAAEATAGVGGNATPRRERQRAC